MRYEAPSSLDQAVALLAKESGEARVLAGGTDLLVQMRTDLVDPVLSFQLREGFRYCGIMPGYLPEDNESCGNASLIVWINPDYDQTQIPALQNRPHQPSEATQ